MQTIPRLQLQHMVRSSSQQFVIETSTARKQRNEELGIRTLNQYVILQKIGEGSFAKVKLVHVSNNPDELYAMKVVKKEVKKRIQKTFRGNPKAKEIAQQESINKEVALLKKTFHPNIIRLYEVIDDRSLQKLYMILEFVKGGPCFSINQEPMNEEDARMCFRDITAGISYKQYCSP
ncbi:MAG: putative Ser/Thr protein kinase [Streblomastix strix]|uniref:Putative Ser/Thr protein kinase n=1 Tax=Streblomastix strix TaxID=222440 RepID=A0A5J4WIY8_9EUKA|nr:MAG: putative Ser/Thr protein kinase [Streblomastix strix]